MTIESAWPTSSTVMRSSALIGRGGASTSPVATIINDAAAVRAPARSSVVAASSAHS